MMKSLKVGPALLTGVCMLIGMAFGLSLTRINWADTDGRPNGKSRSKANAGPHAGTIRYMHDPIRKFTANAMSTVRPFPRFRFMA